MSLSAAQIRILVLRQVYFFDYKWFDLKYWNSADCF